MQHAISAGSQIVKSIRWFASILADEELSMPTSYTGYEENLPELDTDIPALYNCDFLETLGIGLAERNIALHSVAGKSPSHIAAAVGLDKSFVENRLLDIFKATNTHSSIELRLYVLKHNLSVQNRQARH